MEAAGVARAAEDLGVPFYCIRAVSDLAGEDFANDFNAALTPDGRFSTLRLVAGAWRVRGSDSENCCACSSGPRWHQKTWETFLPIALSSHGDENANMLRRRVSRQQRRLRG